MHVQTQSERKKNGSKRTTRTRDTSTSSTNVAFSRVLISRLLKCIISPSIIDLQQNQHIVTIFKTLWIGSRLVRLRILLFCWVIGASHPAIAFKKSYFLHPIPSNDFHLFAGPQLLRQPNRLEKYIRMMVATVPNRQFCCVPFKTTASTPKQQKIIAGTLKNPPHNTNSNIKRTDPTHLPPTSTPI